MELAFPDYILFILHESFFFYNKILLGLREC